MIGLGLYRPRSTPLHLLPAWVKMLGLVVFAVTVFSAAGVLIAGMGAAIATLALVSTLPPWRSTVRGLALLALMAAFGGLYHWIWGDPALGSEIAFTLFAIAASALALNSSTSTDDALGVFIALSWPVRRWIPATAIGLMATLMLRAIPEAAHILAQARDAARARGVSRRPAAILMPTAVRTVSYALRVGDAITARGLLENPATRLSAR